MLKSCLLSGISMFTSTGCNTLADSLKLGRRSQGCCPETSDRESSRDNVDVSSCPTSCMFFGCSLRRVLGYLSVVGVSSSLSVYVLFPT